MLIDWEDYFYTRALNYAPLAILTGSIHKVSATGEDGITRENVPAAFASGGKLKPCLLVKGGEVVYDGVIRDGMEQVASYRQRITVLLYQYRNYDVIDAARALIYTLFEGFQPTGAAPFEIVGELPRERDRGALLGCSMAKMDFLVMSVREG